jgi:hypothetical protein
VVANKLGVTKTEDVPIAVPPTGIAYQAYTPLEPDAVSVAEVPQVIEVPLAVGEVILGIVTTTGTLALAQIPLVASTK